MFDSSQSPRKNLKTSVGAAITMLVLLSACSQQSIDTDDKQLDQTTAAQQVEGTSSAESAGSSANTDQALDQSLKDPATSADGTFSENSSDSQKDAQTVAASDQDLANQVQTDALPPQADSAPSMSPMPESDPLAAPAASASVDASGPAKHVSHKHKKHGKVASHKKHKKHGKKIAKSAHKKSHKKDLPAVSQAASQSTQIDTPKEVGSTLPTDAAASAAPVDQLPSTDVKAVDAMNAATPLDPTMSASPSDAPLAEPLALSAPSTNWKVWGAWAALMAILVGAFVVRMKKRKAQGIYYNP